MASDNHSRQAIGIFRSREIVLQTLDDLKNSGFLIIEGTENDILLAEPILKHWGIQEWRIVDP
jgi:hypothetical protein